MMSKDFYGFFVICEDYGLDQDLGEHSLYNIKNKLTVKSIPSIANTEVLLKFFYKANQPYHCYLEVFDFDSRLIFQGPELELISLGKDGDPYFSEKFFNLRFLVEKEGPYLVRLRNKENEILLEQPIGVKVAG